MIAGMTSGCVTSKKARFHIILALFISLITLFYAYV